MGAARYNGPKLAFIGFGEAGLAIAGGLKEAGVDEITAYDILLKEEHSQALIKERSSNAGVSLANSHAEAISGKDIIISAVTCNDAVEAAHQTALHLEPRQTYMDVNSVSPMTKKKVQEVIETAGATFLEASILSPILPHRHASPMLLSGPAASDVIKKLSPFGMHLTDTGPEFGRASATKMFRSIIIKGLEALLQECVIAADRYGVAEIVLDSVGSNHPEIDWKSLTDYYLGRSVLHGIRRGREMEEVADTLRSLNIEPLMAEAAAKRIHWLANRNLEHYFDGKHPNTYRDVLDALSRQAMQKAG